MPRFTDIQEVNDTFTTLLEAPLSDDDVRRVGTEWVAASHEIALAEGWSEDRAAGFTGLIQESVNRKLQANAAARSEKWTSGIKIVALVVGGLVLATGAAVLIARSGGRKPVFALGQIMYPTIPE